RAMLVPKDVMDAICAALPDPEALCASTFTHVQIEASALEPAHVLASPREDSTHVQTTFEYHTDVFAVPEDPLVWRNAQQTKYSHWAAMHPSCRRATVAMIPQAGLCRAANRFRQPQCRVCISRTGIKRCKFVDVRYITQLKVELASGATATRYLICPTFRSQGDKTPAIRQQIAPIMLPADRVVDGDEAWVEFHILCQTVASIKSLLRRELAVVRDVPMHEARGASNGCISFFDTATAVLDEGAGAVHPLYGCSPTACMLRRVPFGAYQKCDMCLAPIFSSYFACCLCMVEFCVACFTEWDDSGVASHCYAFERGTKTAECDRGDSQTDSRIAMSYCKRFTKPEAGTHITYSTRHRKPQFVRVSHFSDGELELMLRKANRIVQYCDLLDETQPASYSSISLCANALGVGGRPARADFSWITAILDRIDTDTTVIANLGDADYGGDISRRPGPAEPSTGPETPGAGPSHSQSQYLEAQWDAKLRGLLAAARLPLSGWHRPPLYVPADGLSLREFARVWEEGYVVVVTGLLTDELKAAWTPAELADVLGSLCTPVFNAGARRSAVGDWPLRRLLECLAPGGTAAEGVDDTDGAKLPSSSLYARVSLSGAPAAGDEGFAEVDCSRTQELCQRAAAMVPFPQYTSASGALNLANRLPAQYARPDFGPELQVLRCADNTTCKENMGCEVADMVSLMMYSARADCADEPPRRRSRGRPPVQPAGGGAHSVEWDIYPPAAAGMLQTFLEAEAPRTTGRGDIACGQQVFVHDSWCQELYEQHGEEARCFRVYQGPGDAVLVPSGCLYQRRSFASTVTIQASFLSPEHVATARRLSSEAMWLDRNQRRKQALPVMDILWWTWMGRADDGAAGLGERPSTPPRAGTGHRRSSEAAAAAAVTTPAKRRRARAQDPSMPAPGARGKQDAPSARRRGRPRRSQSKMCL
ncbi:hypothetical protein H4R19_003966, partial [Coemansia spiralis]